MMGAVRLECKLHRRITYEFDPYAWLQADLLLILLYRLIAKAFSQDRQRHPFYCDNLTRLKCGADGYNHRHRHSHRVWLERQQCRVRRR